MPLIEPKSQDRDFARLDWATQNFYWTLRTHLDPLGRHSADPDILVSTLFPLKRSFVRSADIIRWLTACEKAGIGLRCYHDSKGRPIVEVKDAVQSKMRSLKSDHEAFEGAQTSLQLEPPPPPKTPPGRAVLPRRPNISSSPNEEKGREEKRKEGKGNPRAPQADADDGTMGNGKIGEHPTSNIQHPTSNGELPDEKSAVDQAHMRGIPIAFATLCYADWFENEGRDSQNHPKPWIVYVAKRWRYESEDWQSGKHRGKSSAGSKKSGGTGPTLKDVTDYAKQKGDTLGTFAAQFHKFWSGRNWLDGKGHRIDWQIKFSEQYAKHRESSGQ